MSDAETEIIALLREIRDLEKARLERFSEAEKETRQYRESARERQLEMKALLEASHRQTREFRDQATERAAVARKETSDYRIGAAQSARNFRIVSLSILIVILLGFLAPWLMFLFHALFRGPN